MFNSGVFLATSDAVRKIRRNSIEFTYRLFNEWQRVDVIEKLPPDIRKTIESKYPSKYKTQQDVLDDWPIEQGALALACIKSNIKVRYLDEVYNSWGGDEDFRILHCFKSLYKFSRGAMYSEDSEPWIEEYLDSADRSEARQPQISSVSSRSRLHGWLEGRDRSPRRTPGP